MRIEFLSVFLVTALISGCDSAPERPGAVPVPCTPIEAKAPIFERAPPPADLDVPLTLELPTFVDPVASDASSCLTPAGEQSFLDAIDVCIVDHEAWRTWGRSR